LTLDGSALDEIDTIHDKCYQSFDIAILDQNDGIHNDGSLDENNGILENCSWTPSEEDMSLDIEIHNDKMNGSLQNVQSDEIYAEDKN
jgi:hypothetical protein